MRPSLSCFRYTQLSAAALEKLGAKKWRVDDGRLVKRFAFPTHTAAADFVARIARVADASDHHPDVTIKHRFATFRLRTNAVGEITDADEKLATEIDAAKVGS